MTSLYKQSIPPIIKNLKSLSVFLEKGVKFADEKGTKHEELLSFQLAPDMKSLPYQVQSCCNTAKFLPVRLGVAEDVFFADDEATFEQLQTRIAATIDFLQKVDEKSMEGKEAAEVLMKTKSMGTYRFDSGQQYFSAFALPNIHFHLATAYCILRHLGVPVGAMDYLGKDTFVKVEE